MLAVMFQVSWSALIYSAMLKYSIIIVIMAFAAILLIIFYSSSFHKGRVLQLPFQGLWSSAQLPLLPTCNWVHQRKLHDKLSKPKNTITLLDQNKGYAI